MLIESNAFWIFIIILLIVMVAVFIIELALCLADRRKDAIKDEILNEFDRME